MIFKLIKSSLKGFHAPNSMERIDAIRVQLMYILGLASMVCAGGLDEILVTERGDGGFAGEWHNRQ
jgi:hypothetical protein